MKMFTKITAIATLATFMFAGVNVTWGNAYSDTDGTFGVAGEFGVWFDMNDATSIGWEDNAMMIGLAGPAGMTFRLGYEDVTTLGVSRSWWSSNGNGWATSLNTSIDFSLVNDDNNTANDTSDDVAAGAFTLGVNLGFGF